MKLHQLTNFEQLVYYATRAPSGHNSQPWKFLINEKESTIEIQPDFNFTLPIVDPNHRELYISLGCAAENLWTAATALNYKVNSDILTTAQYQKTIKFWLRKSDQVVSPKKLAVIEQRQTNRRIYKGQIIPADLISELKHLSQEDDDIDAFYFQNGSAQFSMLKEFILLGNSMQMSDPEFKRELLSWIRFNPKEVAKTQDGLSYKVMGAPPLPRWISKLIIGMYLTPKKQNKTDIEKIDSSSHLVLFTSRNNSIEEWIRLGRILQRTLLKCTELGIAHAYLNPPCELPDLAAELQQQLLIHNKFPSIILRIGYARKGALRSKKSLREGDR